MRKKREMKKEGRSSGKRVGDEENLEKNDEDQIFLYFFFCYTELIFFNF